MIACARPRTWPQNFAGKFAGDTISFLDRTSGQVNNDPAMMLTSFDIEASKTIYENRETYEEERILASVHYYF